MEVEIFTLCEFAHTYEGNKLTIVGTFDGISAQQFPVQHPTCSIAIKLRFAESETGQHTLLLKMVNDKGTAVFPELQGNIEVGRPAPGQHAAVAMAIHLNQIPFEKAGRYSFELHIDGEWRAGLPLLVSQVA
ncbi:MAG: hypothetical protein H7330_14720 [Hymenobacteraceae bacterium]|nr:hypothetical protein [Hymenobacteraceae bacterium]